MNRVEVFKFILRRTYIFTYFEGGGGDRKFFPKMGREGANGRKLGGRRKLGEIFKIK